MNSISLDAVLKDMREMAQDKDGYLVLPVVFTMWADAIDAHLAPREVRDEDVELALDTFYNGSEWRHDYTGEEWKIKDCMRAAIQADRQRGGGVEKSPIDDLVDRFADALRQKLHAAEKKYGYSDAWMRDDWRETLIRCMHEHIEKGDPRDVAAYCAFAWHHSWKLEALLAQRGQVREKYEHRWDRDGEHCLKCGDKDWMGGPCSVPDVKSGQAAVASHAEGEVVAIVGEAADTWKIAAYGNENTGWIPPGDKIKTAFFLKDVPIGTSLYSHPPRSGDEARDADNLKKFAHAIFQATDWPDGGDLDGFEFQEIAVKCGLLEEVEMKEPCGDVCHCYDMGADFPARCFRKTPLYYTCAAMAARGDDK